MFSLKYLTMALSAATLLFVTVAQAALPCCALAGLAEGQPAPQAESMQEAIPCHEAKAEQSADHTLPCDDCSCVQLVKMHPQPATGVSPAPPLVYAEGWQHAAIHASEPTGIDHPPKHRS